VRAERATLKKKRTRWRQTACAETNGPQTPQGGMLLREENPKKKDLSSRETLKDPGWRRRGGGRTKKKLLFLFLWS